MKRRNGTGIAMFLRVLLRAVLVRKSRALTALLALVVACAAATAMLNLYVDTGAKLEREFRAYGANLVVTARGSQSLATGALAEIDALLAGHGVAVPFTYAIARTPSGAPMVIAGTDMERVRRLNPWWSVSAWPSSPNTALVGTRALRLLAPNGAPFDLQFQNKTIRLTPSGALQTGADEDSRVYIPMRDFQQWTGLATSTIEIAVTGSTQQIESVREGLAAVLPRADVKPVRQIVEAEARTLAKTRATVLASAAVIILTSALCVLATLMAWVLEQQKNVAIMKALGARQSFIDGFVAAQAVLLGVIGGGVGYLIGIGIAAWIGRINFHAAVLPRLSLLPVVLAEGISVALTAAAVPLWLLRRVKPAVILRGE